MTKDLSPRFESDEASQEASEAEALFHALLAGVPEGCAPDIAPLCTARPNLSAELKRLVRAYLRASRAMGRVQGGGSDETVDPVHERYRVRREIACGGMGRVLEVWDTELRRTLAMKVLRDPADGAGIERLLFRRQRSRLINEAQILAQLEHPGIIPIHEVGLDAEGQPYFTMLRVQGRALTEVFEDVHADTQGWSTTRTVGVLLRVCEAVAHAHSKGVVHRDLKPSNVMVGPFGEVFVMDWGLAKARGCTDEADIRLREAAFLTSDPPDLSDPPDAPDPANTGSSVRTDRRDSSESDPDSPLHTMDGDIVGTPAYMSPEQAKGRIEAVDERSDVYSLGAILYHLLAAKPPYCEAVHAARKRARQPTPRELLARVQREAPRRLAAQAPWVGPELVAVCEKAMARDPARRYASMLECSEDLRAHLEGRVVKAHRSGLLVEVGKWVGRHKLLVSMLGLVFVILAGSTVGFGLLYREAQAERVTAERRLELLRQRLAGPKLNLDGIASVPTFHDDFEDGILTERLRIWSHPELVEERDGRLFLVRRGPSSAETFLGLDPSREVIRGDFDLSVVFDTEGFSGPLEGERTFGMNVRQASDRRLVAMVHRLDSAVRDPAAGECREAYEARSEEGSPIVCVPTTDRAGRLRIARVGAQLSTYYWDAGWQQIISAEVTSAPLSFGLYCLTTKGDDGTFSVVFDDLRLEHPTGTGGRRVAPFVETFDGALSRFLRPMEAGGVAGVVGGEAVLETFPGGDGYAELELDWPTHALRGDFEVSFDYELQSFPLPRPGDGVLFFQLLLVKIDDYSENVACLSRFRDPEQRWTDALNAWTDPSKPEDAVWIQTSGTTGRFRAHREGTRLRMESWDAGWQLILEREGVSGDIFFRIHLKGSTEGALISVDNLRVEGLHEGN